MKRVLVVALLLAGCAPMNAGAPQPPPAEVQALIPGVYDGGNAFARIIRGELPAAKVYEDVDVLAFMDIAPVERGHVLVISKRAHARNLLEMDGRTLGKLLAVARRIGAAQMRGLGADGFSLEQNNGYGQTVPHLHVHVIPRYRGQPRGNDSGPRQTIAELEPVAAKIRAALRP